MRYKSEDDSRGGNGGASIRDENKRKEKGRSEEIARDFYYDKVMQARLTEGGARICSSERMIS